ncbi:hypothetical protein LAZ67_2003260 [Cordylochernes scorpioides]|uniref:Transposase n=1 Tax=Cordylochernes scorpioides TaxID=51811 RepID=A0ABY6K7A7_9ARAC|nr:hypothetical protein LAZ67_2003260 [Cordylochernes scorpioides]
MESVKNEKRVGSLILHRNPEKVRQISNLIKENPRIGLRDIEEETGISKSLVESIIKEDLQLKETPLKFVHKMLTIQQKENRVEVAKKMLEMVEENSNWKEKFVTMDETWAHHFTPESKQQSMQWRHSGSPPPKKAKTVRSAGKVMLSVFWDSEGVLLLDFLNKGQTITGNYYANLVKQLREAIKEIRRGKLSRKIV